MTYIFCASLFVVVGSYILSNSYTFIPSAFSFSGFLGSIQYQKFLLGVALNLIGSGLWINGRSRLDSYVFAWTLYVVLLIVFGAILSFFIEKSSFGYSQFFGLLCAIAGLILLSQR